MAATDIERGLSTAEVEERIAAGKINRNMELKTKSVKELIIENLCTLFNLINVILAFLVILTGDVPVRGVPHYRYWRHSVHAFQKDGR